MLAMAKAKACRGHAQSKPASCISVCFGHGTTDRHGFVSYRLYIFPRNFMKRWGMVVVVLAVSVGVLTAACGTRPYLDEREGRSDVHVEHVTVAAPLPRHAEELQGQLLARRLVRALAAALHQLHLCRPVVVPCQLRAKDGQASRPKSSVRGRMCPRLFEPWPATYRLDGRLQPPPGRVVPEEQRHLEALAVHVPERLAVVQPDGAGRVTPAK